MGLRRKNRSPAVLGHEFVIQNHVDTAFCLVVGLLLGLVFEWKKRTTRRKKDHLEWRKWKR